MDTIQHRLATGEVKDICIYARDRYSRNTLSVLAEEQYRIWYDAGQRWTDLLIPASPAGYINPIADMFGQRVKGAKCFCLCAAYNYSDTNAFSLADDNIVTTLYSGTLSFFANDVPGFDWNNWGKIWIHIQRIQ